MYNIAYYIFVYYLENVTVSFITLTYYLVNKIVKV